MDIVTIRTRGGLGNQLFQIMTAISYGIDYNKSLVLRLKGTSPSIAQRRKTYWDTVFKGITTRDHDIDAASNYKEARFRFDELPNLPGNVQLEGYFQSYRYFDKNRDEALKTLCFDKERSRKLLNSYRTGDIPLVSVHFRRGDYKKLQMFHNVLEMNYYKQAFEYFKGASFLVFCEECDKTEIQTDLAKIHPRPGYAFSDNSVDDHTQMYMMSLCDHNIISNSSYSWWGAYMNNKTDKAVVAPVQWFGPAKQKLQTVDLIPDNWTRL